MSTSGRIGLDEYGTDVTDERDRRDDMIWDMRPSKARPRMRGTNRDMTGQSRVAAYLRRRYESKADIKALVKIIKTSSKLGYLPCPKDNRDFRPRARGRIRDTHRLQVHDWNPTKFRCGLGTCKLDLQEAEFMNWIAELVDRDIVPKDSVGYEE